ncbi:peroxisomal (S)-2-hydroxy-acid oxidase GLO5 isoform X2 [Folsomia candida]|nr:peroxisomal (S)-2-hydroxy-acid oxidase GLO5 isoform X2 [Folsomia candida]XP_035705899.1 peroxisomal (S)-2-hydroxy-acid oxidase GLO5 isoform X2 [Folsomia candida]
MLKLVCVDDFYTAAKSKLTADGTWDYLEGGSDDQFALQQSRKAFQRYVVRPRFLRDVSTRDLSATILGKNVSFPVGVAPMAMQKLAHPDGECAAAMGAGAVGTIYILSTMSTCSIEEVANAAPNTRLWFQLYYQKDRNVNIDLISRAEKAGYEALVLTLDTQMIGKRRGNLRTPFNLPENAKLANFESSAGNDVNKMRDNSKPVRDMSVTWDVINWIRGQTTMKLVLKGILTGEDATLAVENKVDGIIVSNHGGRQLDCVLPPIDALAEVVAAVGKSDCEVYMDGGVSLGSDVFKALALGAKMVFVGRGVLWGLAVGGQQGVTKVLDIYRSELDLTLALSGVAKSCQINSACVQAYSPQ